MRFSYKSKLLVYFTALFALFTALLVLFQYNRERQYKREVLEARLLCYADLANASLGTDGAAAEALPARVPGLPRNVRVTVINHRGGVEYESVPTKNGTMDNHAGRPEVHAAFSRGTGSDIRLSETEGRSYFYFAKMYGRRVVRVALPYNEEVQNFMKADNVFLWFVLMVFPIALVMLIYISDRFGKAVNAMRGFIASAERGLVDYDRISFPDSDLGEMCRAVMAKYRQLDESNRRTALERERLMRHFHYLDAGIAIFTPERRSVYANPPFTQFVNTILDRPTANIDNIWDNERFAPVKEFLQLRGGSHPAGEEPPVFRYNVRAGSVSVAVQVLVYSDGSFELSLSDVTRAEKNRKLKQEMSNNITHELRTPVSSIRGYLETVLDCDGLSPERKRHFLEKARAQAERLTDLIRDVALITKTEEAPETMPAEEVDVAAVARGVADDLAPGLAAVGMEADISLPHELMIQGNYSLVYSVFRNLMENSIRYAGEGTRVCVTCYKETAEYCYFCYYDTGKGVPDEHLPRLFERFYRVTDGRTRDTGGTGLGLSIVRNAVQYHGGSVTVRNRREGGLEFLFTLHK